MVQHNLSLSMAAENYVLLTIGDGLVAQIPPPLFDATAIVVTRISDSAEMNDQIVTQLFDSPRPLFIAAAVIGSLGLFRNAQCGVFGPGGTHGGSRVLGHEPVRAPLGFEAIASQEALPRSTPR